MNMHFYHNICNCPTNYYEVERQLNGSTGLRMLYYQHLSNYHPKHFQMTISSGEGLCLLRPVQLVMYCGHKREKKKKKHLKINNSYKTLILPGLLCFTYINSGNLLLIEVGLLPSTNNEHINLNSAFPLTVRKSEYSLDSCFWRYVLFISTPSPSPLFHAGLSLQTGISNLPTI